MKDAAEGGAVDGGAACGAALADVVGDGAAYFHGGGLDAGGLVFGFMLVNGVVVEGRCDGRDLQHRLGRTWPRRRIGTGLGSVQPGLRP